MKRLVGLVALLLSLSAGSVFGYTLKFLNWDDNQYTVKVEYTAPGVCSPDEQIIPPVEPRGIDAGKAEINTKTCCAKKVFVIRVHDKKTVRFHPPVTGFGVSCKSWTAEIMPLKDGGFIVSRKQ